MSNMFASRKGPILIVAGVLGGIFYATYGGKQQPRPRATSDTSSRIPMSETLQSVAGTGGERAHGHKDGEGLRQFDSKDTRLASANPTADSKRNLQKSQGELYEVGAGHGSPGGGLGKHARSNEGGRRGINWVVKGMDIKGKELLMGKGVLLEAFWF